MITTQRLLLRPMIDEDALHLFELNSDPEVVRYTGDGPCRDVAGAQRIVTELSKPQFDHFKMGRFTVLLHDGTYLGWCGLKNFPEFNEVDLGYRFHQRFWGKGYASEASHACLQYGFDVLKLKKIVARAMPANIASIKVLQKLGMTFRGLVTESGQLPGFILYDITADEFNK